MSEHEESDQLPEEGPSGQVPEDDKRDRDEASDNPGAAGGDAHGGGGQSSGNPENAG